MNTFKKIFLCSLVLCHSMTMASDDRIGNALAAGLITAGAVIFGGITWKITSDYSKQAQIDLEQKTMTIITVAEKLIAEKSKYSHRFESENFQSNQIEAMLETIIVKYDKNKNHAQKQSSISTTLKQDIQELQRLKNNLSNPCFAQKSEITQVLNKASYLLENALHLLVLVEKHHSFFEMQHRLNFYTSLPTKESETIDWIYSNSSDSSHPLLHYAKKAEDYLEFTENIDITFYPKIAKKVLESRNAIKKSILYLYKTEKIQAEAHNKKQDEMHEAQLKIAHEKNQIEKFNAEAKKRNALAQEELARNQRHANDLERKKIEEIQKKNNLLALRYPVEQENNRLQAEKNRLEAEKNRVIAEQNRLQSERNRIDTLYAENRRREITAIETQNRLQAERYQQEKDHLPSTQNYSSNPPPSAPPAREDSNIPVATPYSGNQPPQATAQYRNE